MSCMNNEGNAKRPSLSESGAERTYALDGDPPVSRLNADATVPQYIRGSFQTNKSVPTNGKNVKLIIGDVSVILRGVVKSKQEKISIGALVRQFAGSKQVSNYLEVNEHFEEASHGD